MKIGEAIDLMIDDDEKMTHCTWEEDEYIFWEITEEFLDESGDIFEFNFAHHLDGWEIYTRPKRKVWNWEEQGTFVRNEALTGWIEKQRRGRSYETQDMQIGFEDCLNRLEGFIDERN